MLLGIRKKRGREGTDLTSSLIWERCKCRLQQGEEKKRKPLHNVTTISLFPSFTFPFQTFSPPRYPQVQNLLPGVLSLSPLTIFIPLHLGYFHFLPSQDPQAFIIFPPLLLSSLPLSRGISCRLFLDFCISRFPLHPAQLRRLRCLQMSGLRSLVISLTLDTAVQCSTVPPYKEWALQRSLLYTDFFVQFH